MNKESSSLLADLDALEKRLRESHELLSRGHYADTPTLNSIDEAVEMLSRCRSALRVGEPTEEMIQAWHDRMIEGADYIDRNSIEYALYVECYKAMLAARAKGE